MPTMILERPIFIIGAARSGTTLLGNLLSQHKNLAYWEEPKYIWRYGNPAASHDARSADEANEEVRKYIGKRFARFTMQRNKQRFIEKTPSNCFRVPFMNAVFPNGLFIHLQRDGRDAAASASKHWLSRPEPGRLAQRIRYAEIPLRDSPYYLSSAFSNVILRALRPNTVRTWGPRFPGIDKVVHEQGLLAACAMQWFLSVQAARQELAKIAPERVFNLDYEAFVSSPDVWIAKLLAFCGLEHDPAVYEYAKREITDNSIGGWVNLPSAHRDMLQKLLPTSY